MKKLTATLAYGATSMMLVGVAQGSLIVSGGTDHLVAGDVNDDYVVSVNSNNPGYANTYSDASNTAYRGLTINKSFNGPIVAYRFVNVTGGPGSRTLTTVVESGGIIAQMTSLDEADNDNFDSFGQNKLNGYTTNDPGSDLLAPLGSRNFTAGIRDLSDFSGSVDISGMTQGSIYLFYGRYNGGGLSLTATLSDTVLPAIPSGELFTGPAAVVNQNIYVTRIDFVNDQGYDQIDYTSNGSRLVGAVVTSVIPEPSSLALLGLSVFGWIVSRRRCG